LGRCWDPVGFAIPAIKQSAEGLLSGTPVTGATALQYIVFNKPDLPDPVPLAGPIGNPPSAAFVGARRAAIANRHPGCHPAYNTIWPPHGSFAETMD
jgi:hypothetical protein